jgi:hypothetical protein
MSEKDTLVLSDKQIIPTDDYIFSILGEKKILWLTIMNYLSENCKDSSGSWNYYNDGKQWLFKMVHKKKTIFWAGVLKDTFRVTFYFGDKAENLIYSSDLSQTIKDDFKTGKRYGKIRAISLKMSDLKDVESVKKLVVIKMKIK